MLKIDSNQCIKMSRGDDVKFPLFVNKGTTYEPIRYKFSKGLGCEIYFYIFDYSDIQDHPWDKIDSDGYNPNTSTTKEPILMKTFSDDGTIKTILYGEEQEEVTDVNNINEYGDMIIWLSNNDTKNIPQGDYIYQIKAKLIDFDVDPTTDDNENIVYSYVYNTVTNRLPIYIIDDNYSNRVWE